MLAAVDDDLGWLGYAFAGIPGAILQKQHAASELGGEIVVVGWASRESHSIASFGNQLPSLGYRKPGFGNHDAQMQVLEVAVGTGERHLRVDAPPGMLQTLHQGCRRSARETIETPNKLLSI